MASCIVQMAEKNTDLGALKNNFINGLKAIMSHPPKR
jgi:hypothetical protein